MDVIRAMTERRSIRAFKPDPLPKELLVKIVDAAVHAPSWANTQCWEFAIVTGDPLKQLGEALIAKEESWAGHNFDIPLPNIPEDYDVRRVELGLQLYELLGIKREDVAKRRQWAMEVLRFFGAPVAVIVYVERSIGPYALLDVGLVLQNILLAAWSQGVGSCLMAAALRHPDEIRRILDLPSSKMMVCGLALGYIDPNHPANKLRTARQPLEDSVRWYGF